MGTFDSLTSNIDTSHGPLQCYFETCHRLAPLQEERMYSTSELRTLDADIEVCTILEESLIVDSFSNMRKLKLLFNLTTIDTKTIQFESRVQTFNKTYLLSLKHYNRIRVNFCSKIMKTFFWYGIMTDVVINNYLKYIHLFVYEIVLWKLKFICSHSNIYHFNHHVFSCS